VVTDDNKVMVAGGRAEEAGGGLESVSVEILDMNKPISTGWTLGVDLPEHRERFSIVLAGDSNGKAPVAVGGWHVLPQKYLLEFDGSQWIKRAETLSDARDNQATVAYSGDYFDCKGGVGGDGGN